MNGEQRSTTASGRQQQVRKNRSRRSRLEELVDETSPASTPAAWRWSYDLPVGTERRGR